MSSIGRLASYAGRAAYCASKAALVMLSKGLALELAGDFVPVNCVGPGGTRTPVIPSRKLKCLSRRIPLGCVGAPENNPFSVSLLRNLKAFGFPGAALHLVNPGRKQIFHTLPPCRATVTVISAPVDPAVLLVGRDACRRRS